MIGPLAAVLIAIVIARIGLFLRQRDSLQRTPGLLSVQGSGFALDRARRLLQAELGRVVLAVVLLGPIGWLAQSRSADPGLAVVIAALAYLSEATLAGRATVAGLRGKGTALLLGTVSAAAIAGVSAVLITQLPWLLWLVATAAVGVVAMALYQLCEWLWLRPRREPRAPLQEGTLRRRLQALAQRCGLGDASFSLVDRDAITVNMRAESDPRGRRVVLWPALLQRLDGASLDAVVAHELGHLALRHAGARFLHASALGFVALLLSSLLASSLWLPHGEQACLHAAAVAALLPVIHSSGRYWLMALYRRHEYAADRFVSEQGGGSALADALLLLSPADAAIPVSDRWHSWAYDSHPATQSRLARLRKAS